MGWGCGVCLCIFGQLLSIPKMLLQPFPLHKHKVWYVVIDNTKKNYTWNECYHSKNQLQLQFLKYFLKYSKEIKFCAGRVQSKCFHHPCKFILYFLLSCCRKFNVKEMESESETIKTGESTWVLSTIGRKTCRKNLSLYHYFYCTHETIK